MTPPSSNASEQSGKAASPPSTVPDPPPSGLDSESRTTVDARFGICTCGCGNPTPGRLFVPGHNQRLRSELTRAYRRAQLVRVVQPVSDPVLIAAPAAAELLGPEWLAWVAPDVEVIRATQRSALDAAAREFEVAE